MLVTSEAFARAHGPEALARIAQHRRRRLPPEIMGIGPVPATERRSSAPASRLEDIDVVELNEAFAAQALAVGPRAGPRRRPRQPRRRRPSRSVIRSAPPAPASPARRRRCCSARARRSRWRPSASAAARGSPPCSRRSNAMEIKGAAVSAPGSWAAASPRNRQCRRTGVPARYRAGRAGRARRARRGASRADARRQSRRRS